MTDTVNPTPSPSRSARAYWKGLEDLADTPEYRERVEKEFASALEPITDPVSRRKFMGLMGAAVALSGLVGCRRPLAKILPYSRMPEDLLPGVPQTYATVMPFRGAGEGVLVTSHEGRPTKIEGNPDHPSSEGATHVFAQASILDLYDPDRARHPMSGGEKRTWEDFSAWAGPHFQTLSRSGGAGLAFLVEPTASPTVRAVRKGMARAFPRATWHTYEPLNRDNVIAGTVLAFGRPLRAQLRLDQADVVLSLDSDFLFAEPNVVRHARDFARGRRISSEHDSMNRLYVAESDFSVTGAMADHRLRISHGEIAALAKALSSALAKEFALPPRLGSGPGVRLSDEATTWIQAVARDLAAHPGRAVILAGSSHSPEVHALVHFLNDVLGARGNIVRFTEETYPGDQTDSLRALASAIDRGSVQTLVVLGGNPAYNTPADLDLAGKLARVENTVHLTLHANETTAQCSWQLPMTHYLEAWGDAEAWDGTRSLQQPLVAPLYEGKSELELLALLGGNPDPDGHALVRNLYRQTWGMLALDTRWNRALHDGVIPGTAHPEVPAVPDGNRVGAAWNAMEVKTAPTASEMEVVFRADASVWDGSFSNNGWMQELPDNMTTLVWDNAAIMSPGTARELGVKNDRMVTVRVGDASLDLPVFITPGLSDFSIQLPLGYGRTHAGRIGNGVGFNTYALRSTGSLYRARASVQKTAGSYRLVTTQTHHTMNGYPVVREASLDRYQEDPHFATEMVEMPELVTLYTNREYDYSEGYQWGMSIDLTTCTGCNACAIACQSENNIAIVGKDQVDRGREMHWIRIDRYYTGEADDPEAVHQPLPCMNCENAPCESVCPVGATTHSEEGLNQMVYNRCIGTRYCNNNCPYKVRRFNYYNWRKGITEVEKGAMNPDVTVRMRGIMEKCTYCVQRINRTRIESRKEDRKIQDGEIVTACQQVCPTESIIFGDVNDPGSRVSKLKEQNRDYTMLAELNVRPRTSYLAKIRNLNPELARDAGQESEDHG